jgi:hypothetical protein
MKGDEIIPLKRDELELVIKPRAPDLNFLISKSYGNKNY